MFNFSISICSNVRPQFPEKQKKEVNTGADSICLLPNIQNESGITDLKACLETDLIKLLPLWSDGPSVKCLYDLH